MDKLEQIEDKLTGKRLPLWLDVKQAAGYLNISESLLRKLIGNNEIPFTRIGESDRSKILLNRKELDFWLLLKKDNSNKRERKKVKDYISKGGDK